MKTNASSLAMTSSNTLPVAFAFSVLCHQHLSGLLQHLLHDHR